MLECKTTCPLSRVDLKKSPSSRIGQPREKQSDDLKSIWENQFLTQFKETETMTFNLNSDGKSNKPEIFIQIIIIAPIRVRTMPMLILLGFLEYLQKKKNKNHI